MTSAVQRYGLVGALNQSWLKLPTCAMRDVGPASQTLGGIISITSKETFASAQVIADAARVPAKTCRKHLDTLHDRGWIQNEGRQATRRGIPRRTCTIKLTKQTKDLMTDYAILPWFATCYLARAGKLPWSTRAVLGVIMARLCSLKAAAERESGPLAEDEVFGAIENMGSNERFRFSLSDLVKQTGLSRESVCIGKLQLSTLRLIDIVIPDDRQEAELLVPCWDRQLVITPSKPGFVTVSLGWSESG
ncbi:MAG: hypothetical protein SH850_24050 [Planctomycetaceae bacterium]|nr:hypothetical protein [Planctomycetaceae bacterium]